MAEWLKALVLKTRDGNIRKFESCPFRQKKLAPKGYFLAAVFQARMFPLVAVFVVIIAILLRNWSQFNFSCHRDIIPYMWYNG